jgi:ribose-phosphate pyrophosphokinase
VSEAVIQALPLAAKDAARLASRFGISMHEIDLHRFPDGELRVTVGAAAATTIIYAPLDQPNDKLLAILFAAEALRREGVLRLVLVAPYLCYMRQDAAFHKGDITVDAHLHRAKNIEDIFPGIEADDLSAMPVIAKALHADGLNSDTLVVGPDEESGPWVGDLAGRLGLKHVVACKTRRGDRAVEITFADPALFKDRPVLLVDDIVSSGGTLIACAKALVAGGATAVDAVITHALFPPEMTQAFLSAGLRSIRSTSSVPHPTNAIALDDVLADALRKEICA